MAYMHGNLAMKPNNRQEQEAYSREVRKKIVRRRPLPVQEKLLYLFTVVVCVMAASVIIFRYAEIYRMNLEIRDPNEITEKAIELGMVYPEFDDVISLEVGGSSTRTALKD